MKPEDIQKKQEEYKVAFGSIPLAHDVGLDVVSRIAEKKADFPDIEVESQPLRIYPLKNAGAQVVGYVGEAGPDERNAEGQPYTSSTLIGRTGLEYQYNSYLEGKRVPPRGSGRHGAAGAVFQRRTGRFRIQCASDAGCPSAGSGGTGH